MPTVDQAFLDERLAGLEQLRVCSPRVTSMLENVVRDADDRALFRVSIAT